MKKESENSASGKWASWSIVGLVLAGTLLISGVSDVSEGSGAMAKIFLTFLAAVIVVQVIPGLVLLGAMFKGIYIMFGKKEKVTLGENKK
jgi:ABC-type Na+ efflux pump permease subunit